MSSRLNWKESGLVSGLELQDDEEKLWYYSSELTGFRGRDSIILSGNIQRPGKTRGRLWNQSVPDNQALTVGEETSQGKIHLEVLAEEADGV